MKANRDFNVYKIKNACEKYLIDIELFENSENKAKEEQIHAVMTRKWFPKLSRESAINYLILSGKFNYPRPFTYSEVFKIKELCNLCSSNIAATNDVVTLDEEYINILVKYIV